MDDSIPSGENKLPLFVSFGAIAVAVIALLFAFKARSEAKSSAEGLKDIGTEVKSNTAELSRAQTTFAKAGDVQAVQGDLTQLKNEMSDRMTKINDGFKTQGEINTKLLGNRVHGDTAKPTGKPGDTAAPAAGPGEYLVKSGDTGTKIAKANGVSVSALTAANPGVNFSKLHVGQKIKLPAAKAPTAPKAN